MRTERLAECVEVMRALFAGEEVTHRGHVQVDRARLWTRPAAPPPLYGAAVSAETAGWVGGWADGLATIHQPRETLERVVSAFREGGGDGKPMVLQVHVSYAPSEEEALEIAFDQWRTNVFSPPLCWDLQTPEPFDEAAKHVRPDDMGSSVIISAVPGRYVEYAREAAGLGFETVVFHHVGQEQRWFIESFGEHVLPELRG